MALDVTSRQCERLTLDGSVTRWLAAFQAMLGAQDFSRLSDFFIADSHWRDMGAFTWDLGNVSGIDPGVGSVFPELSAGVKFGTFELRT